MKLRKLLAASTAAAIALSATAFNVSAATVTSNSGIDAADGTADAVVTLFGENIDMLTEYGLTVDDVYGFEVVLDVTPEDVNGEAWIGGGIGTNSESTGWASTEWGQASGAKPIVLGEDGVITLLQEEPLFDSTDTYMQLWLQAWGLDVTVEAMSVLGADGEALISDIAEDDGDTATEAIAVNAANSPYTYLEGEAAIDITNIAAEIELCTTNATANWNAWCNSTIAVTVNDVTEYFVFAGTQVGWDVTLNAETEDEVVIAPADFATMADDGVITVDMPVDIAAGDTFSVEFICQAWTDDTSGDPIFKVNGLELTEGEAAPEADIADFFDGSTLMLYGEEGDGYANAAGLDITEVYGVKFYVTFDEAEVADENVWIGGGVGANSDSTGWEQHEYGKASGAKEIVPDFENGTITWFKGSPVFTAEETFAQLWIQSWGGALTVNSVELLDASYVPETPETGDAPETGDSSQDTDAPTTDKQSPDTGVEGIAAIAGVVALAGAAVVISRKRK